MAALTRKLKTLWQLSFEEKLWALFIFPCSGLARASVLTIPFKHLSVTPGEHHQNYQLSTLATEAQIAKSKKIGRIIALVSEYTPWKSNCLVQALLARWLLSFYGIPHVIYFGVLVTKKQSEAMKAHAWLLCGSRIVVGAAGHKKYGIVSTFVSKQVLQIANPH